jgi:hypothetical protein
MQTDVTQVLNFLTELVQLGMSYSTINSAKAALSTFLFLPGGLTVGSHPLMVRFGKGVFNLNPPMPKYSVIWDVRVVLNYLRALSPIAKLRLRDLSLKLTMLLALLSAQRTQTLHLLRIDQMTLLPSKVIFNIIGLLKQSRPGNTGLRIELDAYPTDTRLCIVTYLSHYLKATAPLRGLEKQLLISFRKPHEGVSKDTVARWIKTVMYQC